MSICNGKKNATLCHLLYTLQMIVNLHGANCYLLLVISILSIPVFTSICLGVRRILPSTFAFVGALETVCNRAPTINFK